MSRVAEILGAVAPAAKPAANAIEKAQSNKPADQGKAMKLLTHSVAPGLAVGAAGAYLWKKHRVLGFLAGSAVGACAYPIVKDENRYKNVACLAAAGVGVAASLKFKKHPALAYVGGSVAASIAAMPILKRYA